MYVFRCWNVLFGFIYLLVMLVLLLVFAASACHPAFMAADTYYYRDTEHMYEVTVDGHRPLSLYLKCEGNGSQTILFENGLGGMAYFYDQFVPRMLSANYTVCTHDRRGYGWSETLEHDVIDALLNEPQWTRTNIEFLRALLDAAGVRTPFYYVGHSYGGHHAVYMALAYPDLVTGLVLLDSAEFGLGSDWFMELLVNTQPSGALQLASYTGLIDILELTDDADDLQDLPEDKVERMTATLRSGYYVSSDMRERWPLLNDYATDGLQKEMAKKRVTVPVLVLDKDGRDPSWFPASNFTQYSPDFHTQIPCASHTSLVLTRRLGQVTADVINAFVSYAEEKLSLSEFVEIKDDIIERANTTCLNDLQ